MAIEADLRLDLQDLVNQACHEGMSEMAALTGAHYMLRKIEEGFCRDRKEMVHMWAAFADGFLTRMKLEGDRVARGLQNGH